MKKFLILLLLSIGVGYYLFGVNFNATLGMVDDHEIVSFLGPDQKIKIEEIPKLLLKTEVGKWGSALRFRPVYYTLRIIESMAWKDNPQLWYGTRLVIFALSLTIGYLILSRLVGVVPSVVILGYILAWDYWKDIWTRLGPSEIYAVLGLAVFAWGVIKDKIWMIVVGAIVCMGSKENFFFLLLPLLYLLLVRWKQITVKQRVLLGVGIVSGILVALPMYLATKNTGVTFYHESLSLMERVQLTVMKTPKILYWYRVLPIFAISVLINSYYFWKQKKIERIKFLKKLATYVLTLSFLGVVVASQVFFYGDLWPGNNRYDFPGVLAIQLFGLISVLMLPRTYRKAGVILLTIYLIFFTVNKGYYPIREEARRNMIRTRAFQSEISSYVQKIHENPGKPILFESNSPLYYEQIASTRRYLLYYGAPEIMYFRYSGGKEQDALYGALAESMRAVSAQGGNPMDDSWGFSSYHVLPNDECVSVIIGEVESVCVNH